MSSTTHDHDSTDAHAAEPDESIAVSAWVEAVRAELAEFDQPGDSVCRNVRGVVALARANAERIGHPVPGDLLWWARALDRWAKRARERADEIVTLREQTAAKDAEIATLREQAAAKDAEIANLRDALQAARKRELERKADEWNRNARDWPAPEPSAVRVLWPMPFVATFEKAEREFTMALVVATCVRLGDRWQVLTWADVAETYRGLVEGGTVVPNPFVQPDPQGCVDGGWIETIAVEGLDPMIAISWAAAYRLREKWAPDDAEGRRA